MSLAFDANRWWPAPLLPRQDGRDYALLFVVAALSFLAGLTNLVAGVVFDEKGVIEFLDVAAAHHRVTSTVAQVAARILRHPLRHAGAQDGPRLPARHGHHVVDRQCASVHHDFSHDR